MPRSESAELTFIEHVHEVRRRLLISVLCIGAGAAIGWSFFDRIIQFLSQPLQQTLYYSAPTGELSFMIKVCIVFGLVVTSPIVFYHVLRFIQPVITSAARRHIVLYCLFSVCLGIGGVAFAYFVSLPMTLTFLMDMQSDGGLIQPLISADEYFNFVLAYIAGFAVLFQVPLFVLVINKITPLTPSGLFKSFRFVVLFSFIAAAIITPTPDPINQAVMAVPVIVLYFISAMLLVLGGLTKRPKNRIAQPAPIAPMPPQPVAPALNPTPVQAQASVVISPVTPQVPAKKAPPPQRLFVQDIRPMQQHAKKLVIKQDYVRPLRQPKIISDFL